MRGIVVVGGGGIGGTIAGFLHKGGHDVTVVDPWTEHVDAIIQNGLRVETTDVGFVVPVPALIPDQVAALKTPIDLLIISVKAYDTEDAYKLVAPKLSDDTTVVCAQNGITEDTVVGLAPPGHVIGCAVTLAAEFSEPGVVHRTSPDAWPVLTIGELNGPVTDRIRRVATTLGAVGEVTVTDDVAAHLWSKLARNAMTNGIAALTGGTTRNLWSNTMYQPIVIQAAAEAAAVAAAAGVTLEPIAGRIHAADLIKTLAGDSAAFRAVSSELRAFAIERTAERDHLPSMLQDAMKRRRTEIDGLNGYVCTAGRSLSVPTPMNDAIVELVHRLEAGELTIDPENLKLLEAARQANLSAG